MFPASLSTDNPSRLYTFFVRYDDVTTGGENRVLSLRMLGPLDDDRVWAALRWVASSMLSISREWRGVMWDSWPECPEHPNDRTYLATPDTVRGVFVSAMYESGPLNQLVGVIALDQLPPLIASVVGGGGVSLFCVAPTD